MLIAVLLSLVPLTSFAADPVNGSNVSYKSTEIDSSGNEHVMFEIPGYSDYLGCCYQFGVPQAAAGTAKATLLTNSSDFAKAVYYFGYELGWAKGLGQASGNKGYTLECILQHLNNTFDPIINNPTMWSETAVGLATRQKQVAVKAMSDNPDWGNVTVPSAFKIYACDAGSDQDFLIWSYVETSGKLKLKKSSTNTSITG